MQLEMSNVVSTARKHFKIVSREFKKVFFLFKSKSKKIVLLLLITA